MTSDFFVSADYYQLGVEFHVPPRYHNRRNAQPSTNAQRIIIRWYLSRYQSKLDFFVSCQGPFTGLRVILLEFLVFIPLSGGRILKHYHYSEALSISIFTSFYVLSLTIACHVSST
jgi:hypothetical protein